MQTNQALDRVDIRPGVSILSVLPHLNYRAWYAIAEFVDNSLQSYLDHHLALEMLHGAGVKLRVDIALDDIDGGTLTIRDSAAGISEVDYGRAFRPAALPPVNTGLCEFGMGMKSAACWFSRVWSVRTTALGEGVERTITFDTAKIVSDSIEELPVRTRACSAQAHFTEITLAHLHKPLHTKTISKIKEHLASIYRVFIRSDLLELSFSGERLAYEEPRVLRSAYYKDATGVPLEWRKSIDLDFGNGVKATGFAGIRERASTVRAGFALFRRNRLVQGSVDEGYRPEAIFGRSNSYRFQRLFGELHLTGFDVTHTKDGFRWEDEDAFVELLRDQLDADPLPLLRQAEGYRARHIVADSRRCIEEATQRTAQVIQEQVPAVLEREMDSRQEGAAPPRAFPLAREIAQRTIDVVLRESDWQIVLEVTDDESVGDWVSLFDCASSPDLLHAGMRRVGVRMSSAHPFVERFGGPDGEQIEPLLRIAAALGLAETVARDGGIPMAGAVRHNVNELLRDALSFP
jgi:hypothetical protein